jgi:uncharacterized membrane protein YgcG
VKLARSNLAPSKSARLKLAPSGAAIALLAGALVLAAPLAAGAEDPVDLAGAYVLDTVGVTTGDEAEMQSALDSLYDRASIQLFAVFVDDFTNPTDAVDWADASAVDNNLGTDDVLLAVATGDRVYAMSVAPDFRLSDAQLGRVEDAIEAQLRDDDWSGAVVAGAQALEVEATGVVGPNGPTDPVTPAEPDAAGFPWGWVVVGGAAVVGGGLFIYSRTRKRSRDGTVTAKPEGMSQEQLDRRAGSLLVQLDDSLKSSEQELGFAVAQFGDQATADFTAVLASAKQKVQQAFTLQQQLDDVNPETPEQKRAITIQIIQLTESADAELDAQADAFDELRQLEKNAPQELAEVRAAAAKSLERKTAAAAALATLESAYSDAAVKSVAGNIEQADKLLTFAEEAAKKADAELVAGSASEAAIAVRTAQAGVGQVGQLFDAIDALAANLADASAKLDAAVADTRSDIVAAKALPQDARSAGLAPAIAAAEAALAEAGKTDGDPLATLGLLEKANASLDQVFESVRDEQDRITRAKSQMETAISGARSAIQAAAEYITTRRGGIGDSARTRISEANRHLTQAISLSPTDPVAALAEAQTALELGNNALALARRDVDSYQQQARYDDSVVSGGGDGADLGGLLGGLIFGNGGYRGGRSGGSSGGGGIFGGGGSSYRAPRTSRSGGFGGSSRSSSRSSGGRSRGGRF